MIKWLAIILSTIAFGTWVYDTGFFSTKLTHKSHHGAADLFMKALQEQNVDLMQTRTRKGAVNQCPGIMSSVHSGPNKMERYLVECGGSPGNRTSGRAFCYGSGGELFVVVAFTIEKFDEEWYVTELGTERR